MRTSLLLERTVYVLVITLLLVILVLTLMSTNEFLDINSVYQGF